MTQSEITVVTDSLLFVKMPDPNYTLSFKAETGPDSSGLLRNFTVFSTLCVLSRRLNVEHVTEPELAHHHFLNRI